VLWCIARAYLYKVGGETESLADMSTKGDGYQVGLIDLVWNETELG
jgi:hypothetical protein